MLPLDLVIVPCNVGMGLFTWFLHLPRLPGSFLFPEIERDSIVAAGLPTGPRLATCQSASHTPVLASH